MVDPSAGYIALLATGGTIATTTEAGRSAPRLDGDALAAVLGDSIPVRPVQVSQLASWALGPREMWAIALRARDAARDPACAGVVITHGTSTLEYTAYFVDLALDADTPVVLTGAMRRADDPEADGPANLAASVRVVAHPASRGRGALVCFAGEIFNARDVWKAQRADPRAFVGIGGAAGRLVDGQPVFGSPPGTRPGAFSGDVETRVALVKAFPGAGGSVIDAALAPDVRGLVLEGLPGSGGIPPAMRDAVERATARCRLVVLASRAPYGRLVDTLGGTGAPLTGLRLVSAGTLTPEKAFVLLSVVLGSIADDAAARAQFERRASS